MSGTRHIRPREARGVPARNADLNGMVPEHSSVALLLDVINDLEFPGGERLVRHAVPMARRIARLRARAKRASIPVILYRCEATEVMRIQERLR